MGGRRLLKLQATKGFRTRASATEEWSGSPSAAGPVSPAAAASSFVAAANRLADSPDFGAVGELALAFKKFRQYC